MEAEDIAYSAERVIYLYKLFTPIPKYEVTQWKSRPEKACHSVALT